MKEGKVTTRASWVGGSSDSTDAWRLAEEELIAAICDKMRTQSGRGILIELHGENDRIAGIHAAAQRMHEPIYALSAPPLDEF